MTADLAQAHVRIPTPSPKRQLGAFYTPDHVALILVRWALHGGSGPLLDPSFGGCAFLKAGVQMIGENGGGPEAVVGVDVDPTCRDYASGLIPLDNARIGDFMSTKPHDLPFQTYAAIVGNPPFVRHHWLKGEARTHARDAVATLGLPDRASTWAYFVLHSLRFLSNSGRLALLVPEAILQADYAVVVREHLKSRFARTRLIHLRSRLFAGTDEAVVLIAAEGVGPGVLEISHLEGVAELTLELSGEATAVSDRGVRGLSDDVEGIIRQALESELVRTVGSVAEVRIGTVTGANQFFVVGQEEANELGLPDSVRLPIVSRTRFLSGLEYTKADHQRDTLEGGRTLLIAAEQLATDPAVLAWAAEGDRRGIPHRHKCGKRETWFVVRPVTSPGLFGTCSRRGAPLLAVNEAGATCTNALHCVNPKPDLGIGAHALAAGFLSTLTALVAERHGRRYGGGILKIEPGTFVKLPLIATRATDLNEIDRLLREGKEQAARELVDRDVLETQLGLRPRHVQTLRRAVRELAAARVPR